MLAGRIFSLFLVAAATFLATGAARATEGIILVPSAHDVKTTTNRLEKTLTDKGITVFARVDHAGGAESVGQKLRPTELLIFGNPKLGTPLMQQKQEIGLDLPLKALVFQGEDGKTYIAYTDPAFLSKRYGLAEPANVFEQMSGGLKNFTAAPAAN